MSTFNIYLTKDEMEDAMFLTNGNNEVEADYFLNVCKNFFEITMRNRIKGYDNIKFNLVDKVHKSKV